MTKFSGFQPYIPVIQTLFWTLLFFRVIETVLLVPSLGWSIIPYEVLGFLLDLILTGSLLLLVFPLFYLLNKLSHSLSNLLVLLLLYFFSVAHFLILAYFIHQLIPLDIFLYQHPFEEIYFTITTSGVSVVKTLILIGIISIIPCLIYWHISRKKKHHLSAKRGFYFILIREMTN